MTQPHTLPDRDGITDHQMNEESASDSAQLVRQFRSVDSSGNIGPCECASHEWNELLPNERSSFVFGNPPFVGKQYQNSEQKEDLELLAVRKGFVFLTMLLHGISRRLSIFKAPLHPSRCIHRWNCTRRAGACALAVAIQIHTAYTISLIGLSSG